MRTTATKPTLDEDLARLLDAVESAGRPVPLPGLGWRCLLPGDRLAPAVAEAIRRGLLTVVGNRVKARPATNCD